MDYERPQVIKNTVVFIKYEDTFNIYLCTGNLVAPRSIEITYLFLTNIKGIVGQVLLLTLNCPKWSTLKVIYPSVLVAL